MKEKKDLVLIVDDDEAVQSVLYKVISSNGIDAKVVGSGEEALVQVKRHTFDLILLDVNMRGIDGFEVIQALRRQGIKTPIIIVSGRKEDYDTLYGLDIGADDYITKPFSPSELLARVDSLYRRVDMHNSQRRAQSSDEIRLGDFALNIRKRALSKNGKDIELTQVEFQIIEYFFTNPDTALSRSDILVKVWGDAYFGEEKIVDVNIRRLRMKIEDDPSRPKNLLTVWGMGYKWNTAE